MPYDGRDGDVVRDAVSRRMRQGSQNRRSGAQHDSRGYASSGSQPLLHDEKEHAHHPFWNPFPPPDPEWVAGKGSEEMMVSIFVFHHQSRQSLLDNPLFIIQSLEMLMSLIYTIVGLLVMTDSMAINHFIFIITFSIIYLVIIMIHFMSVWYWATQPRFSHKHNNELQFAFFFWIVLNALSLVIIGRYLASIPGSCCGFNDSQPDPLDLVSYNRFIAAYSILTFTSAFLLYILSRALISHYYPEGRYVPSFDMYRSTDMYIDEDAPSEEIQALTSAHGRASGSHGKTSNLGPSVGDRNPPVKPYNSAGKVFPYAHDPSINNQRESRMPRQNTMV